MRSSKSRSRNKANRPRTLGNIVNRVFDSSGPEGKVRGTPQQIIEKYLFLARDAQLSNDRVAAENFLQHAEHYTRMLAEAQREMQAEQDERQRQYGQNGNGQNGNQNGGGWQNGGDDRDVRAERPQGDRNDQNRDQNRDRDQNQSRERDPNQNQNRDQNRDRDQNQNRDVNQNRGERQGNFRDRRDDRRDRDRDQQRTPAAMEVVEAVDDGEIIAATAVVPDFPRRDDLPAFLNAPLDPLPPLAEPQAEAAEKKPRTRAPRKPKAESPETAG